MDLLDQLGYRYPERNAVRRGMVRFAATPSVSRFSARALPILDRQVLKLSGGRTTLSEIVAGTPVILLTTRGARSGQPRTCGLLGIPVGRSLALIGTNFAEPKTPSWVHNLVVHPQATIAYRRSQVGVTAREVLGSEYEQVFAAAALIYPGFGAYRSRLTDRVPRVFMLEAASSATLTTGEGPT